MILGTLYFIAFSHASIITAALVRRAGLGAPSALLAILLALFAYVLFQQATAHSGLYRYIPHVLNLTPWIALYIGPLFYGYVRRMTGARPQKAWVWTLHLAPAAAMWMTNIPYHLQSGSEKIAIWSEVHAGILQPKPLEASVVLLLLAVKTHLTIYLFLSWRKLDRFSNKIDHLRADDSRSTLVQLRFLAISLILLEAVWVGLFCLQQVFGIGTLGLVSNAWLLFMSFIVLAMGYLGLKQPYFLVTQEERSLADDAPPKPTEDGNVKYLHSALPDSAGSDIARSIEAKLQADQLYLDEKLTLTKLAKEAGVKPHTASQVINQHMGTTFYKLINGYRVQHALTLLDDPQNHWSIERIAIESGFANRVTFNKAFKEHLNCTASEYRKRCRDAS